MVKENYSMSDLSRPVNNYKDAYKSSGSNVEGSVAMRAVKMEEADEEARTLMVSEEQNKGFWGKLLRRIRGNQNSEGDKPFSGVESKQLRDEGRYQEVSEEVLEKASLFQLTDFQESQKLYREIDDIYFQKYSSIPQTKDKSAYFDNRLQQERRTDISMEVSKKYIDKWTQLAAIRLVDALKKSRNPDELKQYSKDKNQLNEVLQRFIQNGIADDPRNSDPRGAVYKIDSLAIGNYIVPKVQEQLRAA